ncbi:MAG: MerR family transcriptional regulator [Vicinamibacterales bacterium]
MFRIGEFSRVARVSGRLLRYYDSIGLLNPRRIDPTTGYRYYTVDQLVQLNRVLALKDLGLSLEQVARMVGEKISTGEIRGMLMLKKTELERTLSEEAARLRHIESRLQQIDEQGSLRDYDIVVKSAAKQPYLSVRRTYRRFDDAIVMLREVSRAAIARIPDRIRNALIVVAYSDFEEEDLDLEIGFALKREMAKPIALPGRIELTLNELPAVESLATVVRSGPNYQSHLAFGALGIWMEANGFQIAGPSREVFLELPFQRPEQEDSVVEIQFPITKAA